MGASTDSALLARALRNPGRLCIDPISLSGSFPFGGRSMGVVTAVKLKWDVLYFQNRDPASGAVNEVARRHVEVPTLGLVVDGPRWDEDVRTGAFSKLTTYTTAPVETRIEGTLDALPIQAVRPILFAPTDPELDAVYVRRPLILLTPDEATELAARRKAGLPILLHPTPDTAYATTPFWQIAPLSRITL